MSPRQPRALAAGGLFIIVFAILAVLVARELSDRPAELATLRAEIRRLQSLDSLVNEFVLQARSGHLRQYDPLTDVLDESKVTLSAVLATFDESDQARAGFLVDLRAVRLAFEEKRGLVETFKSRNAILANSTRFYPRALAAALEAERDEASTKLLRDETRKLVVEALRLAYHQDELHAKRLLSLRRRLASLGGGGPEFEVLLAHTEKVAEYSKQTASLIGKILTVPIGQRLGSAERGVTEAMQIATADAQHHRSLLCWLSAALLGYAVLTWFSLRRKTSELHEANSMLEERIVERTEQLSRSNSDLRREVEVRQLIEENNASLASRLAQANKELEDFTYIAAHDLQEPLRKLHAFSELLEQDLGDGLSERAAEDLLYIKDASVRMKSLISDLLALSRTGTSDLEVETIDLAECVEAAVDNLYVRIMESSASVEIDELPTVTGDRTLLTQLFQNLIGNALKFVEGKAPCVVITCRREGDEVVFGVRDNGIGIEPEYLESVFAPFTRLQGRGVFEGTGIGLSIAKKAVDRHGGRIWVESEVGVGTEFKFTLRLEPSEFLHDEPEAEAVVGAC